MDELFGALTIRYYTISSNREPHQAKWVKPGGQDHKCGDDENDHDHDRGYNSHVVFSLLWTNLG